MGTRGAFVQYGHRVRRVHLNAGEVRATGDGTRQPHRSARAQPGPDGCVGVLGPRKDRAHELDTPRTSRVVLVKDAPRDHKHSLQFVANSQNGGVEWRGSLGGSAATRSQIAKIRRYDPGAAEDIA